MLLETKEVPVFQWVGFITLFAGATSSKGMKELRYSNRVYTGLHYSGQFDSLGTWSGLEKKVPTEEKNN